MSAFVQPKEHIDALVRLAIDGPRDGHGRWARLCYYLPAPGRELPERREWSWQNADELGHLLWLENLRSIAHRYPDSTPGDRPGPCSTDLDAEVDAYTLGARRWHLSIGEGLKAVDGLVYQSCEHPEWHTSEAKLALEALAKQLARHTQDYAEAPTWSINSKTPVPEQPGISLTELMARKRPRGGGRA